MSHDTTTGWPKDFVWGVSTSSYQIEGAAQEDGRAPSIWDTRCRLGKIANGDSGDVACDHYHRYREDVALMKELGIDAYRFSVAWPRVLPKGKGAVNFKGLEFYDRLIDELLANDIEPWLCLYHWDLPQALHDIGGWAVRDSVGWFEDYATLLARRYGDRVKKWITFNEFSVFTLFGYAIDWSAPGITDRDTHLKAIHHVNLAHGAAVDVIRAHVPGAVIGAVHNRQAVWPEHGKEENKHAAALLDEHWNRAFPDPQLLGYYPPMLGQAIEPYVQAGDMARICRPLDFFGLNHYGPIFAKVDDNPNSTWGFAWGEAPADADKSELGWAIFPDAFRDELIDLTHRYKLPIYVTENGCGGGDTVDENGQVIDNHRVTYLKRYTASMHEAIEKGADVRGYFVWSLLDNFEWGSGYGPRFGLVHVDYETQKRTKKASFDWYANLIKSTHGA
ncbi:GH1 family beta-glucosidase [Insolitispirillum peregrinum]|uniref:Beta-glucosidase n=1 Tax=Insolitispirillum peregrinum TaxID=80876 RepID=A0A1N7NVD0_9PROT|nr:GH1 family beta-glucosidase [Insolitispirillum peregrinum]SIT02294.1 beta-glucosidase [Insolitispirillum peregrinum]